MTSSIESKFVVGSGDDRQLVIEKSHALVEQALDLRHSLPIFQRLEEVLHRHLEIKPALRTDRRIMLDPIPRLLRLLSQHLLIKRHHNHVVKVVTEAGVREHSHNVREIIQLMLGEELVVQIETAEDHVDLRHVVVVVGMKWVV